MKLILFTQEKNCCGCGTCSLICPKDAIEMKQNSYGFTYPEIDNNKCVNCGLCYKFCAFQNVKESNSLKKVYAISRKNKKLLLNSASGGAFAAIAEQWIDEGGIVFGAALIKDKCLTPKHIMASTKDELFQLLGSKYVKSDLGRCFERVKLLLNNGDKILFSGTPCQIASLKSYLNKDYKNLFTIDLVCHGVPSSSMFKDYIKQQEKRLKGEISNFIFRDKKNGWGKNAKIIFIKKGKQISKYMNSSQLSYYNLFLSNEIHMDSCYNCPYANLNRQSDITIGDYWGIEEEHPEAIIPNGLLDPKEGVSMLMVNTSNGLEIFEKYKNQFNVYPSTYLKACKHNEQLNKPSVPGLNRDKILKMYRKNGYKAIEKWFWRNKRKEQAKEKIAYHLHHDIPKPIRSLINNILRRK